jgi:signal recognition particle GTPase
VTKKRNSTTELLDEIIALNSAILADDEAEQDVKFKAMDRILKSLTLKERQQKKSGSKFDLG